MRRQTALNEGGTPIDLPKVIVIFLVFFIVCIFNLLFRVLCRRGVDVGASLKFLCFFFKVAPGVIY